MIGAHHQDTVFLKELAMFFGDAEIRFDELHGGNTAQTHQDLRAHEIKLIAQPTDAGILFLRLGIPVFRRTAFDDVGDIDAFAF